MSALSGIKIVPETTSPCQISTGNVMPLLHQIRHALQLLNSTQEHTCIDLMAMPLTKQESDELLAFLGSGEVSISINSIGESTVQETHFFGVWLITHYDNDRKMLSQFIEVAIIPEIVLAQSSDISNSERKITALLENLENESNPYC